MTTATYWCDAHLDYHCANCNPQIPCGDPFAHCEGDDWVAQCPTCQAEHFLDEATAARRDMQIYPDRGAYSTGSTS